MDSYLILDLSMETPNTNCIMNPKYDDVYPPSEDSFLFLDALELEKNTILKLNPTISIEVGSGSGVISSFVLSFLEKPVFHICTDISYIVCKKINCD